MEPGRYYHVFNRGNNSENLFKTEENYNYFLRLYKAHIFPVAATYAYCLMPNHFHFLIRVRDSEEQEQLTTLNPRKPQAFKQVPAARSFSHFFNAYSKAVNKAFGRRGSLFEKGFKYKEVTSESYFNRLIWYIHLNPERHGIIENFEAWPHSSYHSLLSAKPTLLERSQVTGWFGGPEQLKQFHQQPHLLTDLKEVLIDE